MRKFPAASRWSDETLTTTEARPRVVRMRSLEVLRERAHRFCDHVRDGGDAHWRLDLSKMAVTADRVADVVRDRYPDLKAPFHARWRHFVFRGRDLWAEIADARRWTSPAAKARAAFDLAVTSVLLDAGAGPAWRFCDLATGITATRSEGLALASLRAFEVGLFSSDPSDPLRADAAALVALTDTGLMQAFQVGPDNPLVGIEGRVRLLRRLGGALSARLDLFACGEIARPGGLFDALSAEADGSSIEARAIFSGLLDGLNPIWENRPTLDGAPLGDCWPYPGEGWDGYLAFHKLTQWLSYSLIEPLEEAGFQVAGVDALTGLAEYRNGGLFVDAGVLVPRDAQAFSGAYQVSDPFVVGWRALTVALLDDIAPLVRDRLGVDADTFPLACVLEGGTWATGRILAREARADGGPPFNIISDGTVF